MEIERGEGGVLEAVMDKTKRVSTGLCIQETRR